MTSLRGLPRSTWVMLALVVLTVTVDFMIIPYYAVHFTHTLGLSIAIAAAAVTGITVASRVAQFIGGYLTDRLRPERLLTAGFLGMVVAFSTLAIAPAAYAVAAAMLLGLSDGLIVIAMRYRLVANCAPDLRPRVFALTSVCFNVGAMAGPLLGALLLGLSHHVAFGTAAVVYVVAYLALRLLATQPPAAGSAPQSPATAGGPRRVLADLRGLLGHRDLLLAIVLITGFWVIFSQFQFSVPLVIAASGGTGAMTAIGTVYVLNGILVVAMTLPLTHAAQRWPARTVMMAGYCLVLTSFLLLAAVEVTGAAFAWTYGAVAVFTAGEILFVNFSSEHLAAIAPDGRLATYLGVLGLATGAGAAIGNGLSGVVIGPLLAAGRPWLVWIIFVGVAAAFVAVAGSLRRWARPTAPHDRGRVPTPS